MKKRSQSNLHKNKPPSGPEPREAELADNVRKRCSLRKGQGPSDEDIARAVINFAKAFDYWYTRVLKDTVSSYRARLISRINPVVRRFQYEALNCQDFSARIVEDYDRRNFVTAGGWALETLALSIRPESLDGSGRGSRTSKSEGTGIDIRVHNSSKNQYSFYVLKSGTVTRNSDILDKLKHNLKRARALVLQNNSRASVTLNMAVCTGRIKKSDPSDEIRRPSSAEFWSEIIGLAEEKALNLISAIVSEAHSVHDREVRDHVRALETLVSAYLSKKDAPEIVDWDFLNQRNFQAKQLWSEEDRERHKRATSILKGTGYVVPKKSKRASSREEGDLPTDIPLPRHVRMQKGKTPLADD